MKILNRIFNRDDVVMLLLVDEVDDRSLGRALTGSGWTSHETPGRFSVRQSRIQMVGKPSDLNVGMSVGMTRITME